MAELLCPHCGMPNDPEQNVCSFCRQPLRAAEDGESIRPGEAPTKKTTAELEPILPAWLRDARANARRAEEEKTAEDAQAEAEHPAPPKEVPPDLLAGLASAARDDQDEEIPEWMRGAAPVSTTPIQSEKKEQTFPRRQELHWEGDTDELGGMATAPVPSAPESGDALLPWMQSAPAEHAEESDEVSNWLDSQKSASQEEPPVSPFASGTVKPPVTGELTDWLDKAQADVETQAEAPKTEPGDSLGEWLSNLPRGESLSEPTEAGETFHEDIDLPDWMKPAGELPAASEQGTVEASLPDWMESAAQTSAAAAEKTEATPAPDWMSAFRESESSAEAEAPFAEPAPEIPSAPAFVSGQESLENKQADELFSVDMPDWLSSIAPTDQKTGEALTDETAPDAIAPADLPSWVQAMRPVETVLPEAQSTRTLADGPLEEKGPLAGLRGVLPLDGLIQPGKPRAHAIRLQVSEAQQADASLLEQMLAAETEAEPLRGGSALASQRVLRWVISALLILLVSFFLAAKSQSVPLPATLPAESNLILPVLDALPADAPVLMIFDYEPALAGELEAAAAPFVDRVLGLRHPRVTILSTSPTGAALAERFFAKTQARHNYLPEQNYINLGYLPGGTTGILSFAVNPRAAMPLPEWAYPLVMDVHHFSDYAAVILLTDQAETARAWVEQTTSHREGRPMLVISSAQAAPMIQPYLLSGQINGLVSGLHGGAAFENANGTSGLARGYWDAYNYATLLVALTILVGGLWNWIAGVRSRGQGLGEI
ncbi:MAG: zinc ribbon domain-containing protein [Anaerolineaceae bacterium]|nr:MAG: zinc ribbon domain-containing protein [Anaerolineaceae bacterium]